MRPAPVDAAKEDFAASVIEGLSLPQKALPSRFFYDARGSALFEEITALPEYYLTRTETALLEAHVGEMISAELHDAALVEFGSGSSRKTELLLRRPRAFLRYAPIDVSTCALAEAVARLATRFPELHIHPIVDDFSRRVALPAEFVALPKIGFFPGSTIGNFAPHAAVALMSAMRTTLAPGGRLLIGADLKKDLGLLLSAYNDAAGVTAAFNLNLLRRINDELEGTFDLDAFRHRAIYDAEEGRIEMHLVSLEDQNARAAGETFRFRRGETIHTENSYKYKIDQFRDMARRAGWTPVAVWTDAARLFSVHELSSGSFETNDGTRLTRNAMSI